MIGTGRRSVRVVLAVFGFAVAGAIVPTAAAEAHPLGNFTVNHSDALRVSADEIRVDSVVDLAEIPTSQARSEVQRLGPEVWRDGRCADIAGRAVLTLDGRALPLRVVASDLTFPTGAGGLNTTRLVCRQVAEAAPDNGSKVSFTTGGDTSRIGWREIAANGDGTRIQADVPVVSPTRMLTAYPQDLLSSPLDVRTATMSVRLGGPAAADPLTGVVPPDAAGTRGVDALTSRFNDFVGRQQLGLGLGALALVLSLLLGAAHAFAPGHGKTVMAAFLAGERGSFRQVSAIGLTVTATHTIGVLLLGVVLSLSTAFSAERVYPWLGLLSGVLLVLIGWSLLQAARRRWSAATAATHDHHSHGHHSHDHDHDHDHHHDEHDHGHPHEVPAEGGSASLAVLTRPAPPAADPTTHSHGGRTHTHAPATVRDEDGNPLRTRSLIAMGFAGGLVPSPSALVVLLGAIALHRAWFGVLLVLGYGAGMAATLVGIGALLARARGRLATLGTRRSGSAAARITAVLPAITATVIVVLGGALVLRAAVQLL